MHKKQNILFKIKIYFLFIQNTYEEKFNVLESEKLEIWCNN